LRDLDRRAVCGDADDATYGDVVAKTVLDERAARREADERERDHAIEFA
jgi:hypothetical protein